MNLVQEYMNSVRTSTGEVKHYKVIENIKKNQSELKNTITKMKNILEGINSRLNKAENQIGNLGDKIAENTQSEQQKEKRILKK